jgi:16S rRNA (cytosine967-C5)-methyltransferase
VPHYEVVTPESPREIAARVLRRRWNSPEYVETLLEQELARAGLSRLDRSLCQELVYGVVRRERTLDWLIARRTDGRPQDRAAQSLLRLGLYQIFWLQRIPAHAAVHETVELAKRTGCGAKTGFLNAVLRGCLRERAAIERHLENLKKEDPAAGYSHPAWLVERWQARWGTEKTARLLEWNNTPPPTFARLNGLKTDAATLTERWKAQGIGFAARQWDWTGENVVFELKSHPSLAEWEDFQRGFFYVQDASTLLAAHVLNPQPGENILDLCAAPGGKTADMAQRMENRGHILAQDNQPQRLRRLRENCARLGVTCVEITAGTASALRADPPSVETEPDVASAGEIQVLKMQPPSEVGTARRAVRGRLGEATLPKPDLRSAPALRADPSGVEPAPGNAPSPPFDRILLDAPCSNSGVLRRRVDLRWRIRAEELARLSREQGALLRQAAVRLKPGGLLVYSTCSLEPEENQDMTRNFLGEHEEFALENERQLLPFADQVDGAYVAALRRRA